MKSPMQSPEVTMPTVLPAFRSSLTAAVESSEALEMMTSLSLSPAK